MHPVTEPEAKAVSVLLPGSEEVSINMKLFSLRRYFIQQPSSSPSHNCWALPLCQVLPSHSVSLGTFLPSRYLTCLALLFFQELLHKSRDSYNLNPPSRPAASYGTLKISFTTFQGKLWGGKTQKPGTCIAKTLTCTEISFSPK